MSETPTHRNLLFLDCETFGLDVGQPVWEVAAIAAWLDVDGLHCMPSFTLQIAWPAEVVAAADPEALAISRYHERFDPRRAVDHLLIYGSRRAQISQLEHYIWTMCPDWATNPPRLVGLVPSFDVRRLESMVLRPPWHHRLIDVRTLAMGQMLAAPGSRALDVLWSDTDAVHAAYGIEPRPDEVHTALGDARQAVRLFARVCGVAVEGLD